MSPDLWSDTVESLSSLTTTMSATAASDTVPASVHINPLEDFLSYTAEGSVELSPGWRSLLSDTSTTHNLVARHNFTNMLIMHTRYNTHVIATDFETAKTSQEITALHQRSATLSRISSFCTPATTPTTSSYTGVQACQVTSFPFCHVLGVTVMLPYHVLTRKFPGGQYQSRLQGIITDTEITSCLEVKTKKHRHIDRGMSDPSTYWHEGSYVQQRYETSRE